MQKRSILGKRIMLGLSGAILLLGNSAFAYNYAWCANKLANLEKQLGYAQQYNNQGRIYGLQKAIANVKYKCGEGRSTGSSSSVESAPDVTEQNNVGRDAYLQDKILNQKKKVLDAQYEVEKAKLKGDSRKVAEKELKLKKREAVLKLYQDELDGL